MFTGLSLFYQDVVIGRPGARCDALEAQNMIVCIPGARGCYQRTGRVDLSCKIYVHNLRDCAKMGEMLKASRLTQDSSSVTLHASSVPLPTSLHPHRALHSLPRASARRSQFHTPRPVAHNSTHLGPSQQTIALVNMPFRPVPKARGPARRGPWGPCK